MTDKDKLKLRQQRYYASEKGKKTRNAWAKKWRQLDWVKKKRRVIAERYRLKHSKEIHEYLDCLKAEPCQDCKQTFPPICMDFDHVKGVKSCDMAQLVSCNASWVRVNAELEKCELVCSNCHRIRTQQRLATSKRKKHSN